MAIYATWESSIGMVDFDVPQTFPIVLMSQTGCDSLPDLTLGGWEA